MKKSTLMTFALTAIAIAGAAAYIASPFWVVHELREAAVARDAERISQYVDFPAVRESLKADMQLRVMAPMLNDPKMKDNPFAGIGAALASALMGPMVDAMISPAGLALMLQRGPTAKPPVVVGPPPDPAVADPTQPRRTMRQAYAGLNQFRVTYFAEGESEKKAAALIFSRDGLFSWKLTRVRMPDPPVP